MVSQSGLYTDKDKIFNFEQFHIPNSMTKVLALSSKSRIACLNIIMDQAIKEEDHEAIIWSIDEMRILGCQVQDIFKQISNGPNGEYLRSILAPNVVQLVYS